jgi:hypothetical protein
MNKDQLMRLTAAVLVMQRGGDLASALFAVLDDQIDPLPFIDFDLLAGEAKGLATIAERRFAAYKGRPDIKKILDARAKEAAEEAEAQRVAREKSAAWDAAHPMPPPRTNAQGYVADRKMLEKVFPGITKQQP